ncbi:M10 family metallopeptidase C-terminal domain-containing protein [Neptunicoccus sediminis]|uniref:M10 family metallopeptidase C-terminal domain-containing protein n=1 Tax=Neptunicoccus sediminis TaxID=1892596 RepID=UPI00084603AB|nr:M10 family metallopeptidase C-terminal domain-containing protein [Neptunicoccus sediminis]
MPTDETLVNRTELSTFVFGHSLIYHHEAHGGSDQTIVPYWMDAFADAAGTDFSVSGQFGQLQTHVRNLPPEATWSWRFDGVDQAWNSSTETFAEADFDSILITPANYIQNLDPNDPIYSLPRSAVSYTLEIIDYAVTQEPGIDIYIYENWPDMRRVIDDNVFPANTAELAAYHNLTLTEHAAWFDEYHDELSAARPDVNIISIPVGPIISQLLTETPLSGIPVQALYQDIAPHGTETLYFLASVITYSAMYGTLPPEDFTIPSSVHPLVVANYDLILDFVAEELGLDGVVDPDPDPKPDPDPDPDPDVVTGTAEDDLLVGGTSSDILEGLGGNDTLLGRTEDDTLFGARADDMLRGGKGDDALYGGGGNDVIKGNKGADRIWAGSGDDTVKGGKGSDSIKGGNGNDVLFGGKGSDIINGDAHEDILRGNGGSDTLYGDSGDDILIGGAAGDVLYGGAGEDSFVFSRAFQSSTDDPDFIGDFTRGEDVVDLSGFKRGISFVGTDEYTSGGKGELRVEVSGGNTFLQLDIDGDGASELVIELGGITGFDASDVIV